MSHLSSSGLKNDATAKFGVTASGGINPFAHTFKGSMFSELKQKVNSWGKTGPSYTQHIGLPLQ